ncbi:MAG: conjugative relaxase [bacterium]|nr:MAG: conjugative relaxase [bacterium]
MMSITTVSAGQAAHYYSEKDNYYARSSGQWHGKGADTLGLSGGIEKDVFEHLLYGRDADGKELVESNSKGDHRAGVDLTFSAPKSVSILGEITNDSNVREAHEKAVSATLNYLEKNFAQARQTVDGVTERVDTGNLVIAKFQHDTSRELDPQLHTHAVVMNMTKRVDGEWRALSNEELYTNKMLLGQAYRNELAANLKELGYNIHNDHKGLFEVEGVDQILIEHFSRRSEQIAEKVAELKESGRYLNADDQKLREIATLGSRSAKKDVAMEVVRESWQERLCEQGYSKEHIQKAALEAGIQSREAGKHEHSLTVNDYMAMSLKSITEQESVLTRQQALREAAKLSVGRYRISDLEQSFDSLQRDGKIIQLESKAYTTPEMLVIEKDIVEKVFKGRDAIQPALSEIHANAALDAWEKSTGLTLTYDQRKASLHIFTANDRIVGVQGDAGTGKTALLAAVKDVLEEKGLTVKGYAFTGKAAEEMQKGAGIKSQTLHSALSSDNPVTNEKQVWIVDEASLVGSRQLGNFLQKAERSDARLVMVGDTKQLQAIEAGRMFHKLQETGAMKTVSMSTVIRQKEETYLELVENVSAKRIDQAFNNLEKQGRITEIPDSQERFKAMVNDYVERKDAVIVTARNADRNDLNTAIRQELKEQERLNGDEHTYIVRESKSLSPINRHFANSYDAGDLVFARKAGIFGRAGAEARVIDINVGNHSITVERINNNYEEQHVTYLN